MLSKFLVLGLSAVALAGHDAALAQQTQGPWMVRARAVHLDWDNQSSIGEGPLTGALPANAIKANDKTIPEVDISYFFTQNIAAELILTYPQKQRVQVNALGLGDVGTFRQLPPTLTLQYHFNPGGTVQPYVGAGINYTKISDQKLSSGLSLEKASTGGALQAGLDYRLSSSLYLNVDIKKIYIQSDVFLNGAKVSHLKLDPLALGVGLGWKF